MTAGASRAAGGWPGLLAGPAGRYLIALLLVAATVGWRRGQYFSGSVDPVVLGKAALSVLALVLAFLAAQSGPRRGLGTGSLWVLAVVLGGSVFGALTSGTPLAGGMVAVRVAVLAGAVFFLLRSATAQEAFTALAWACGSVALVAAATGLARGNSDRLEGGLPPLTPNELALLAGLVVLFVAWRVVLGEAGPPGAVVAAGALGVIWASGSRTGLLVLLLAVLVVVAHVRRPRVGLVVGGLVLAAVGSVAVVGTGALTAFLERDGTGISTLQSRFIAWDAARTWAETGWQLAFGGGLSVKIIRVEGQWWTEQPLDSSWVSALVQAGLLGLAVAAGWVLWVLHGALRAPRRDRALFLGLLVFLLGRSVVESGLFDATPAFLAFLSVALLAEGGSRRRRAGEPAPPLPSRPRTAEPVS
ncbi:MAG TPA: hypothetical protein VHF92_02860 [Geodermatophilus sp.]|nr:hypothetical protein [Geodermatophilus sp.]